LQERLAFLALSDAEPHSLPSAASQQDSWWFKPRPLERRERRLVYEPTITPAVPPNTQLERKSLTKCFLSNQRNPWDVTPRSVALREPKNMAHARTRKSKPT